MAHGYSSESTQRELSNEYQLDRVWRFFKNICIFVRWMKLVALTLEGFKIKSTVFQPRSSSSPVESRETLGTCHSVTCVTMIYIAVKQSLLAARPAE